jgi:4'-phosphopantetheinyl transferase
MSTGCVKIGLFTPTATNAASDAVIARWARPDDRAEAARRRNPGAIRRTLLGRALIRALVFDMTGVDGNEFQIRAGGNGKPFVRLPSGDDGPAISVSHSGAVVVAAVTRLGALGIDVEYHRPNRPLESLAAFAFGERERAVAAQSPGQFYRIWSLREAMSKATGNGLREAADRTDRIPAGPDTGAWTINDADGTWLLAHLTPLAEYSLAIAVRPGPNDPVAPWSSAAIDWWRPDGA